MRARRGRVAARSHIRELREELGLDVRPNRLLGVDHRSPIDDGRGDALRFVFHGGALGAAQKTASTSSPDGTPERTC
jgi:hypothetical protein